MAEPDAAAFRGTATHDLEGPVFDEKPKNTPSAPQVPVRDHQGEEQGRI